MLLICQKEALLQSQPKALHSMAVGLTGAVLHKACHCAGGVA